MFLQSAFLQVHSQQICEFLLLLNFLLFSPLLASPPIYQRCVRSSSYFSRPVYAADTCRLPFLIADTDSEFSLLQVNNDEPQCNPGRFYHVNFGDTCNHIGALHNAPTSVSFFYITFAHFTYALKCSYQIICENNGVNGQGTNLVIGEVKYVL